jgi:hypothetical protein
MFLDFSNQFSQIELCASAGRKPGAVVQIVE